MKTSRRRRKKEKKKELRKVQESTERLQERLQGPNKITSVQRTEHDFRQTTGDEISKLLWITIEVNG